MCCSTMSSLAHAPLSKANYYWPTLHVKTPKSSNNGKMKKLREKIVLEDSISKDLEVLLIHGTVNPQQNQLN